MPDDEMKRCPFCDEEIRLKALICKHCGQWMPGYTYESAIRDLVLQKQVTNLDEAGFRLDIKSREEQLQIVLTWADSEEKIGLSGIDLSAQDLSGINLAGADLSEANLRDADLSGGQLKRSQSHQGQSIYG